MADFLQVGSIEIPLREISWEFSRAGGPGGQNVNKVESRVTLRFSLRDSASVPQFLKTRAQLALSNRINDLGEIVISSQQSRSQWQNRADCLQRLREMLEQAFRPPKVRRKSKPTKSSKRARLDSKRVHSDKKKSRRFQNDES